MKIVATFSVLMGGPETTDEITGKLNFRFDKFINQINFPITPHEQWKDEIVIIDPNGRYTEQECVQILKEGGLMLPTYEHGIRFALQYGKLIPSFKEKPFILFPHESWFNVTDCYRYILSLKRSTNQRLLRLAHCYSGGKFSELCLFAGVRPRK